MLLLSLILSLSDSSRISTIAASRFQLPFPFIYCHRFHLFTHALLALSSSHAIAIDLHNILGHIHKLIDQSLAIHLGQYATLVIVAQRPAHRLVVHVRLVLVHAPESRDRLGVHQLEDALLAIGPLNEARTILTILQQLEQELPQVCGGSFATASLHSHL